MIKNLYSQTSSSVAAIKNDASLSAIIVGLLATIVSYAGPLLIVFQAAKVANISDAELSSWIWAISFGSGLTCVILSAWFKAPVIAAWSTPGAVLLVSSWSAYAYSDAIGAFVFSAVIMTLLGFSGLFSSIMNHIPYSIATAMLAGILLTFGVNIFVSLQQSPLLVLPMILCYFVSKRWSPRYSVIITLFVGLLLAYIFHRLHFSNVDMHIVHPTFTLPTFSIDALIGLGIPLCIVTMASQNAPGIGVLRADGFNTPVNPLIMTTGFASLLLAPFGAHGINLAAITAAICTGKEAHNEHSKRYIAGIACGLFYLLFGIFGATIASIFSVLPKELIAVVAGLALLASLSSSLSAAMKEDSQRESALITFLVTVSGVSIAGIGAAFWGLVAGVVTHYILIGDIRTVFPRKRKSDS